MSKIVFHTAGDGYWSREARAVTITDIRLDDISGWHDEDAIWGELCVYFDTRTWDRQKHGFIYTDKRFLRELQDFLTLHGLPGQDVSYSEQGMQGDDFVSLDAGDEFCRAWIKKFNLDAAQVIDYL